MGILDLEKDGILLTCLAGSGPFGILVGSLFSFAESGLLCEDAMDGEILLPALSFCKALSLRPVVGIWDLFEDGILLFGGVRSSAPFFFVIEGMREMCESVFSALPGDRTSDGIFDISLLLAERERPLSIELLEGDLFNELEVKLRLLDVLHILPPVSS